MVNTWNSNQSWRRSDNRYSRPPAYQPNPNKCTPVPFDKNFLLRLSPTPSPEEVQDFYQQNQITVDGTEVPPPIFNFTEVEFYNEEVYRQFNRMNYTAPTPIQGQGWPMALAGRDMVGIAQTGSGKTLSFILPALVHASRQQPLRSGDGPIALVLAPTRELVLQIAEVADVYAGFYNLRCLAIYGGVPSGEQKRRLARGVELLIATPGRLIDLKEQGFVPLERTTFLVLDEADRMLDMGFEPQLRRIIPETHSGRQTLMWSATWPREVRQLALSYMRDYIQVNVGCEDLRSNDRIKQVVKVCQERHKLDLLFDMLARHGGDRMIVFCNKKRTCDFLEGHLMRRRFRAAAIHGDKTQAARDRIIGDFKSGRCNILVATDVAARGLDVKDIKVVFIYDFPTNCESYVHRIGRTARGDKAEGLAVSFVTNDDASNVKELIGILRASKQDVPTELVEIVPKHTGRAPQRGFRRRW